MRKTWIISDTHFFHKNICVFQDSQGKMRPWDNVDEMNEYMKNEWNKVVKEGDLVYHLGDAVFGREENLQFLDELNGEKLLIKGNHDEKFPTRLLLNHFSEVYSTYLIGKTALLSHYPVHPGSLFKYKFNIHGHLHRNRVMNGSKVDERYINVSVENIGFRPVLLSRILQPKKGSVLEEFCEEA